MGGLRPKCSILDDDGALALGKFPSVSDERSVTRGEVLALRLAQHPFPDKDRESKTWLSEDTGPVSSVETLLAQAARFELSPDEARRVLAEVVSAVARWRDVAQTPDVGMVQREADAFAPAFEHSELERARALL